MPREDPQDMRIEVEELVFEAEQMGLDTFRRRDGMLDEDLVAHHLACDMRKASRVRKILEQRHDGGARADG